MHQRNSFISGLISVLLCLGACKPGHNDYSRYATLPSEGWVYGEEVIFTPEIADSVAYGSMVMGLRHSASYPYANVWLEMAYFTDSATLVRDTLNIRLSDKFGKWLGNGLGASYQITDTLKSRFTLMRGKPLSLRHIMRVDTLPGIEQIGVTFTSEQ